MYRVGLALTLLTVASYFAEPVQADRLAVPGRSVGMIMLGMPRAVVWKHLGKPTVIHFLHLASRSYTWDYWQSEHTGRREFVTLYRGRVVQIERDVTDNERSRFLFPLLRRQHPHLSVLLYTEVEDNGSTIVADDARRGIAWAVYIHDYTHNEFNTQLLSEIGPDRIILHKPNTVLLPNAGEIRDKHDPSLGDIRTWFAAEPTQKGN